LAYCFYRSHIDFLHPNFLEIASLHRHMKLILKLKNVNNLNVICHKTARQTSQSWGGEIRLRKVGVEKSETNKSILVCTIDFLIDFLHPNFYRSHRFSPPQLLSISSIFSTPTSIDFLDMFYRFSPPQLSRNCESPSSHEADPQTKKRQ